MFAGRQGKRPPGAVIWDNLSRRSMRQSDGLIVSKHIQIEVSLQSGNRWQKRELK